MGLGTIQKKKTKKSSTMQEVQRKNLGTNYSVTKLFYP